MNIQQLRELSEKWRIEADTCSDDYDGPDYMLGVDETLLNCADDLDALLAKYSAEDAATAPATAGEGWILVWEDTLSDCVADACAYLASHAGLEEYGGRSEQVEAKYRAMLYTAPPSAAARVEVTDADIERALKVRVGLDHALGQLIRGDTMAVGYSKTHVVRVLLGALTAALKEPE